MSKKKRKILAAGLVLLGLAAISLTYILLSNADQPGQPFKIGHGGGNLMGALYLAAEEGWNGKFTAEKFGSTGDIGYALIAGRLDAGFVEIEKLSALEKLAGFERLTTVGRTIFPYGATLVLRKGLNRRLNELSGLKIAVSSPKCVLLDAFKQDAKRLNADVSAVEYVTTSFDSMIPALESGSVDAALVKGAYSVFAKQQGHAILYQNWDVTPGDECCPAIVDQAILVLLAQKDKRALAEEAVGRLLAAQDRGPAAMREAIVRNTPITMDQLADQPAPEFASADDHLVELLLLHSGEDGEESEKDA